MLSKDMKEAQRAKRKYRMRLGRQVGPDHARSWQDFSSYAKANGETMKDFRQSMWVYVLAAL